MDTQIKPLVWQIYSHNFTLDFEMSVFALFFIGTEKGK